MKVEYFFKKNITEIKALAKLKMKLDKKTEQLILSKASNRNAEYYSLVQLWRGKIIERVFAVRLNKKGIAEYQEVERKIEGNSFIAYRNLYSSYVCGIRCVWSDSHPAYYLFDKERDKDKWFFCNIQYYNLFIKEHLFNQDDLSFLDKNLRYCHWKPVIDVIDYVTIYRKYPEIEILSRLGYHRSIYNTAVLKNLKDKSFKKFLCKFGKNYNVAGKDYNVAGKDLLYAYKRNITLDELTKLKAVESCVKNVLKDERFKALDKNKLTKYFGKLYDEDKQLNERSYIDMLDAELYFHLDITQDKNAFPHDFKKWHDYYTERMTASKNKETDEKISKNATKYKKLAFECDGLKLILPNVTSDFVKEGEALHHCVGRMGYNEKMAKGQSLILFVRKASDIDTPFVTMEYDQKKKKILQLYADHDSQPEEEVKNIIYNQWLPKVSKMRFAKV